MSIFSNVLVSRPRRSVFDLSYENKLSFDMGYLVPILQYDVVPGDKFKVTSEVFLRFAPMLAPVMHRVNCYVHYFYVPYRLIWDDWKEFITGGEDGLSQPVFPRRAFGESNSTNAEGSLADYLGYNFPSHTNLSDSVQEYSLLPFRAYQFIYNEYYRDQNLTPPVQFSRASGDSTNNDNLILGTDYPDTTEGKVAAYTALKTLRKRCWEKDYFTSALPFVQRGVASQIPITLDVSNLGLQAKSDVSLNTEGSPLDIGYARGTTTQSWEDRTDIEVTGDGNIRTVDESANLNISSAAYHNSEGNHFHSINKSTLANSVRITETSEGVTITPPTINELRLAEHIQKWLEKNARGGARYIEQILSHFGVRVPDYRLDRPEYLGGGKTPVVISEVLQTSSTDSESPQANMAGHGYAVGAKNKFKYTFEEHGLVLGIISVLPRTAYQDGVSRHLLKFDKFDYYFPEFAHLGEQAIMNCEVFNSTNISPNPYGTWGYQERYAEYKYKGSEVHGDFKTSLDFWHLGRKFSTNPELNTDFVTSQPSDRIFSVSSGNHLWCQVYNNVRAVRPMPKHAIPSL